MPGFALLVSLIIVLGTAAVSPAAKETRPDRPSVLSTDSRLAPGFVTVDQQLLEASDNFSAAPIDTYAENVDIVRFISGDAEQIGAPPPRAVAFRQQSLWEEYRWYILAAVLIVFLQTLVIVDILVERRQRLRIQAELGESHRIIELAASAGELGLWARDLGSGAIW